MVRCRHHVWVGRPKPSSINLQIRHRSERGYMDVAAGNRIPLVSANHGDVDLVGRHILASAKLSVPDWRMVERGRSFHQDRHVPLLADLVEALPEQAAAAVGSHALGD